MGYGAASGHRDTGQKLHRKLACGFSRNRCQDGVWGARRLLGNATSEKKNDEAGLGRGRSSNVMQV